MNKKRIIILVAVLSAMLIIGAVVAIVLFNQSPDIEDQTTDTESETEEESSSAENEYEDKIEAISRFNITVDEGEGFIVTAPKTAIMGNDVEFTVEFSNYFDSSAAVVAVNGEALTATDSGSYVIKSISEDAKISVSGLVRTHYGVIKIAPLGVTVNGEDRVSVNGDYSFTLTVADSATGTAKVDVNGSTLEAASGTYTVKSVGGNLVVTVSGVSAPVSTVTYEENKGYSVEYSETAVGGRLLFSIHVDDDYDDHAGLTVKANGVTLKAVDGIYSVENAPASVSITVEGIAVREKLTLHFENCELPDSEAYKGAVWTELTPVRQGYIFNGWVDENGDPYVIDFSQSEVTLYATWLNADGVDYAARVHELINAIVKRSAELKENWLQLTVADNALAVEYSDMRKHFTEYELGKLSENSTVEAFSAKAMLISADIIGINDTNTDRVVIPTYNQVADNDDTKQSLNVMGTHKLGDGHVNTFFNGVEYNIQMKYADGTAILDYMYEFEKINFSAYEKVTFWMSTNYNGITVKLGDSLLFTAVNGNVGYHHAVYRIDIQDGQVFVNGVYICELTEAQNNGTEAIKLAVHRSDADTYAMMNISHIYSGIKDTSLVKP